MGRVTEHYDYVDGQGELLFRVQRQEPKKFVQCQPDGHGGWNYNLDGVERVLYRLPAVLKAKADGQWVYLVEGERDVHTLERFGRVATTVPGGAGKWLASYTKVLRGCRVVLIGDADRSGLKHMLRIAQALQGAATELRVFLPDADKGNDVTDLLEDCRDPQEAVARLRACLVAYELREQSENVVALPGRKAPDQQVVLIDTVTGEVVQPLVCPNCQDLQDHLNGATREIRAWRLRYARLARDLEAEAQQSPWWPVAIRLFQFWQQQTGHVRSEWTFDRFHHAEPLLKRYGPEVCERAIAGIVYDPFVTTRRNGSKKRHDGWELVFRGADKLEEYANRAPRGWHTTLGLKSPAAPKAKANLRAVEGG